MNQRLTPADVQYIARGILHKRQFASSKDWGWLVDRDVARLQREADEIINHRKQIMATAYNDSPNIPATPAAEALKATIPKPPEKKAASKKKPAAKKAASKKVAAKKTPAKKSVAKKPAAKKAAAPRTTAVEQNGIKRPQSEGNCKTVWDTCDKISAKKKAPAEISEVRKALEDSGIPRATQRSNFAVWRRFHGLTKSRK